MDAPPATASPPSVAPPSVAPPAGRDPRFRAGVLLALILVASLFIKLNHLGHSALKALDESFHAVVAKNLIKHPLTPTLYDHPYLPYDHRDWQSNHVWLHKPPVPLWQMAISMALLGVNTLALRLPSALLATASVYLTYAIGKRLLDRRAALIGAALQAFNPVITALVHGYVFSDHIDTALLFWVELSVYCLVRAVQSGSFSWTILAGIAQGIAYLSKSYPAFVVTGIAIVAALLPLAGLADRAFARLRMRHVVILIAATLLTVAPWTLWTMLKFPREFWWEQAQVFRHLGTNVEGWAAPWDRLIFDFSLRIYRHFYPAILLATLLLLPIAWRTKHVGLWLLLAWGLGVLIPHAIATSKTPSATLIGWPPFFLLFGAMASRAIEGNRWCLGAWFAAMVLAVAWPGPIPRIGWGYPQTPGFARIMRDNIWVLWHVLIAIAVAIVFALAFRAGPGLLVRKPLTAFAAVVSLFLAFRMARLAWRVTEQDVQRPAFAELGARVRGHLPPNAVLLLEIGQKCEHIMAMFQTDRSVYPVTPQTIQQSAEQVAAAGGVPMLVTQRALPLPPIFDHPVDGRYVYALPRALPFPAVPVSPTTSTSTTAP